MKLRLLTLLLCLIGFQQISFAGGQLVGLGAIEQAMYWGLFMVIVFFLFLVCPVNPIWQLRDDYISIEEFSVSKDSLKQILALNRPEKQDYVTGIDLFRSRDFLHQYILNGEDGFAYNPYNPGVKAINYYNFMVLVNGKKLQKHARGSIYEITEEKHPVLLAVNDTIIKYAKLYKVFERAQYKKRKAFDK